MPSRLQFCLLLQPHTNWLALNIIRIVYCERAYPFYFHSFFLPVITKQ